MSANAVKCPKCKTAVPEAAFNLPHEIRCGTCGAPLRVAVYPALWYGNDAGRTPDKVLIGEEASCFYHPRNKAATVCEGCGRFLCHLCDVEFDQKHMCPSCIEKGMKGSRFASYDSERVVYSDLAATLAIAPVFFWPITVFTAPAALFVAVRYWNRPGSLVRDSKLKMVIAAILALLQIAGWSFLFYNLFT